MVSSRIPPPPDLFRVHDTVHMVGVFPGEEQGLATIEGGPLRTAVGVTKWLVRPLGCAHAEWVPEWRLQRA